MVLEVSQYVVFAGWADAPHLTEQAKAEILSSYPPHQHDAIMRGWPVLGSGVIYQPAESEIRVDDFPVPEDAPRAFGMDVGWKWTANAWFFRHPQSGVYYLYECYKQGRQEPSEHAEAIRSRGAWIPGVIDPAAAGRSQKDGIQLLKIYRDIGIPLSMAKNAVDAGIVKVWQLLVSGQLKVFKSCEAWFEEYRSYHRDANGNVVKKNDHLLDATRYFCLSGMGLMGMPGRTPNTDRQQEEYRLPA
ncbi:MAG: hypothetical protein Q8P12_01525, partial [bacterium]|nr:hypothetical protein [bacterium]